MSSARNHAKRSHRSEHMKAVTLNRSALRARRRKDTTPRTGGFFRRLLRRMGLAEK